MPCKYKKSRPLRTLNVEIPVEIILLTPFTKGIRYSKFFITVSEIDKMLLSQSAQLRQYRVDELHYKVYKCRCVKGNP